MKGMPIAYAQAPKDWFRIQAAAVAEGESTSADVYIYDQIGETWWGGGVSAKKFAEQINALDVDTIRLFLNSPGGAAWEGVTIMNSLRRHRARVEVTVDGMAASAASLIAMAGDHITMNRGSMLMIHDAWGFAIGNASDMQETAAILDKLSASYADSYAARAGKDRDHWRALMKAETWFSAEEAVTAGLADEWADGPEDASDAAARFDLSKFGFAYAGRSHAPAPPVGDIQAPAEPGATTTKEADMTSDTIKAAFAKRLGVTDAAASEETLLAALDEALAEKADTPTETAALPEGVVAIDSAVLADLQSKAAQGVEALKSQTESRREGILAKALEDGRIAPASKDTWAALLERDEEGTVKALDSLVKNAIPVEEIGHADVNASEDEALAAAAGWADDTKEA